MGVRCILIYYCSIAVRLWNSRAHNTTTTITLDSCIAIDTNFVMSTGTSEENERKAKTNMLWKWNEVEFGAQFGRCAWNSRLFWF